MWQSFVNKKIGSWEIGRKKKNKLNRKFLDSKMYVNLFIKYICVRVCGCLLCMYAYSGTKSDGELGKSRGESTATPVSLMPRVVLWSIDHRFSGGVQRSCSVYEP